MEHPPLAPKSMLFSEKNYFIFNNDDEHGLGPTSWCFEPDDKADRVIIATLAAQEWRDRADRWSTLNSKIIDKYSPVRGQTRLHPVDSARMDSFLKRERAALQLVADWLAWQKGEHEPSSNPS